MANQTYVNADGVVLALTSTSTSALNTIWSASGVTQTLYGNSGDDNFVIFEPTDTIVIPASHGIYTVSDSAWNVAYTLPSGINNLILSGDLQIVSGNAKANLIETGAYRATVSGGGGDDVFVLSTGAVTIVDPQGSGSDVIYNFNTSIDRVRLDGSTVFTSWASIQAAMTQSGSDVVLNMGNGQTLTFRNMTVSAFNSGDFSYPFPTPAMSLTFDDEFNSFVSSANGSVGWMTSWPYQGVNSREIGGQDAVYYSDSSVGYNPFKVVNGVLDITETTAAAAGGNPANMPYESGVITTYKSLSQLYGYFEINAELPAGQGVWPAFYLQSTDGKSELDVFEIPGRSPTNLYVTATDHATGQSVSQLVIIPNDSTGFHSYGVDWEPNTITFYFDGNAVATTATPSSMHVPMYMIVALGAGASGSWAGAPSSSAEFPVTEQIAYVRAYATAATQDVSGTAAITSTSTQTPLSVKESANAATSANGAAVRPFNGVTITDAAGQTETATVTLSSAANGTLSDPNAASDGSKIANGVWSMTGTASAVATGLYNIIFTPSSQTAASVATTVTAAIKDTAGQTASISSTITATKTVTATPLSVTESVNAVTSANGAAVRPFNGVTITDAAGQTETATVTLSSTANGTLSDPYAASDGSKITNGVWTMTGTASAVATGLYNIIFTPSSSQTAASLATTVTAAIKDTAGQTASMSSTITATQTVTPLSVTESINAVTSANGAAVRPFNGVTITDAAGQTETATATLSATANGTLSDPYAASDGSTITNGVWSMTGTASAVATGLYDLIFTPSSSQTAASVTTTVTAAVKDTAGKSASMSSTITATQTVTPLSVTESVNAVTSANGAAVRPFNGVTITDAASQTETATVTLSSAANGTLSDPNAASDGSKITNGVWTMTGTASAVATGLYNLMFTPSSSQTAASLATTVTASIKDTAGKTASMSSTITATKTVTAPTPDTLTLRVSETTANTDAQFTVSVNGTQVGGVYTAEALHSSGDSNTISLTGDWNSGINNVAISFINDGAARDLYVDSVAYDSTTYAGTSAALLTNGTATFAVGGSTPTSTAPADSLTLNLSEDQYLGVNALFNLYVDGKIVTNPQQVTALHSNNATESFSFSGNFGAGAHTIGIGFVNDGYGGSPSLDRNLYINGVSLNGTTVFSGVDKQGIIGVTNFAVTTSH